VDTDLYKAIPEGAHLDIISPATHYIFSNLNLLQYATIMGDVRLLEDLVTSGVARDYRLELVPVGSRLPWLLVSLHTVAMAKPRPWLSFNLETSILGRKRQS
jgi:hypothetical protein